MINSKKSIITSLSTPLITNEKSYWATHFYGVIQCLHSHKTLEFSPMKFGEFPVWSFRDLRGQYPVGFFGKIERYIQNWGFQYFLNSFLNQKMSVDFVWEIVETLEAVYDVSFCRMHECGFYISGHDSALSSELTDLFSTVEVFPPKLNDLNPDPNILIQNSDICLVLKNNITKNTVGIFGEIEGVHGNKLRTERYWGKKPDFCVLSFGVVKGFLKNCYIDVRHINGIDKILVLFEQNNPIVKDFHHALWWINQLFIDGPLKPLSTRNDEFDFFLNLLRTNWANPVEETLHRLEQFISPDDIVGMNAGIIGVTTDIQN